jgi:coenzyme F420-reducing hydrogenase beta subunit
VGSEEGWSTVFARTKTGEEIVEGAVEKGYIEVKEIEPKGLGLIRRLGESKRRRGSTK